MNINVARLLYITEGCTPFNGRKKLVKFLISKLKVFEPISLRFHTQSEYIFHPHQN